MITSVDKSIDRPLSRLGSCVWWTSGSRRPPKSSECRPAHDHVNPQRGVCSAWSYQPPATWKRRAARPVSGRFILCTLFRTSAGPDSRHGIRGSIRSKGALVGQIRLDGALELGPHPLDLRRIHTHGHAKAPAFRHGFVQDLRVAIEPARAGPVTRVEVELYDDAGLREPLLDQVDEAIGPLPGRGRDQDRAAFRRLTLAQIVEPFPFVRVDAIDLVPYFDEARILGLDPELAQNFRHVLRLRLGIAMRHVAHMQDQVRRDHL